MRHSARFCLGLKNWLITVGLLLASAALGLLFDLFQLQEINLFTLFMLGTLFTAALTASRVCSVVSALAGSLLFELLCAQPRFSLQVLSTLHPLDLLIPLGMALLVGSIVHNSRRLMERTRLLLRADQLYLKANAAKRSCPSPRSSSSSSWTGPSFSTSPTGRNWDPSAGSAGRRRVPRWTHSPRIGHSTTGRTPARERRALPARIISTPASARRRTSGACSASSPGSAR